MDALNTILAGWHNLAVKARWFAFVVLLPMLPVTLAIGVVAGLWSGFTNWLTFNILAYRIAALKRKGVFPPPVLSDSQQKRARRSARRQRGR